MVEVEGRCGRRSKGWVLKGGGCGLLKAFVAEGRTRTWRHSLLRIRDDMRLDFSEGLISWFVPHRIMSSLCYIDCPMVLTSPQARLH